MYFPHNLLVFIPSYFDHDALLHQATMH